MTTQATPLSDEERQAAEALDLSDAGHGGLLRRQAKARLPQGIFDFVEGGSYDEITLRANIDDLATLRLRQRVMVDASVRRQRTTMLGQAATMPVALGPAGFAGLVHPMGEVLAARAAESFGVPFCLSSFSICSIEDVASASRAPFLFQLYLFDDRGVNASLLRRAREAGCETLVLTMDAHLQGRRNRDLDNGLTVPLKVRPKLAYHMTKRPLWLWRWLTAKRRTMGTLAPYAGGSTELADVSDWVSRHYKGAFDAADLEWVRANWPGKLMIKGVLDPEDAKTALSLGADAILVSNHGGRQLDSASSTARAFPAVAEAVGDRAELYFDGGIRTGLDVLKVLGLGAKGCFIGRAYLYGLAADGERGVRTALQLLADELDVGMALSGVSDVNALPAGLVSRHS
ncbi:alpha-hydroxy acid oxidase [Methyloligella sp. 2.7D]|uniref:alpha-hydroxy acid oxidase n=1 Tax=unclassified Methyloligella TaxID=2625955 RepID=UPI001FF06DE6|nr:alpha-hydroxy acid oxidase [Methyloligella sp. GL2]